MFFKKLLGETLLRAGLFFKKLITDAMFPLLDVLQAVMFSTPQLNDNGYWETIDEVGDRDGEILEGRAYLFDGVDDYVELDTQVSLDIGYTLTLKANFYNTTSTDYFIGGDNAGIRYNGSTFLVYPAPGTVVTVPWTKVDEVVEFKVVRISSVLYQIFINGVSIGNSGAGVSDDLLIDFFCKRSSGLYFDGIFGDVNIYNENDELIHSWHCDEGDGVVCYDSVGGNNGTITNATLSPFPTPVLSADT